MPFDPDKEARGTTYETLQVVSLVVGAVGLATGIVLYATTRGRATVAPVALAWADRGDRAGPFLTVMRAPLRRTSTLPIGHRAAGAGRRVRRARAATAPSIEDGTLECASGDRCPRGFVCRVSVNLCFRRSSRRRHDGRQPGQRAGQAGRSPPPTSRPGTTRFRTSRWSTTRLPMWRRTAATRRPRSHRPTSPLGPMSPDLAPPDVAPDVPFERRRAQTAATPRTTDRPARSRPSARRNIASTASAATKPAPTGAGPATSAPRPGPARRSRRGRRTARRASCAGSGICGAGACSAASATACAYPGDEITCRSASCSGATFTARAGCNGAGSCPAPTTSSCGDLACNASGTACLTTCTADNQCVTAARPYCDARRLRQRPRERRPLRDRRRVREPALRRRILLQRRLPVALPGVRRDRPRGKLLARRERHAVRRPSRLRRGGGLRGLLQRPRLGAVLLPGVDQELRLPERDLQRDLQRNRSMPDAGGDLSVNGPARLLERGRPGSRRSPDAGFTHATGRHGPRRADVPQADAGSGRAHLEHRPTARRERG